VGSGVTKFKKGDEVYACPDVAHSGKGAYAEYVVAKETETALKPKSIDHVRAAAIPMVGLTAWQALFDTAALSKGQKILIHGAAGGVGSFAVQLAKWKGAHVVGTASGRNQAFLRELGVDDPIDYETLRGRSPRCGCGARYTGWRHPEPFVEGAEEGRDSRFDCLSSSARGSCQARRALGFPPSPSQFFTIVRDRKARRCWETESRGRNRAAALGRPTRSRTQRDRTRTRQDPAESCLTA
jgi:threonine dehydrogenase-like Zn-dependent dehydrogenase